MYKLTSLIISIVSFVFGLTVYITYWAITKHLPSKDETIGLAIFILGINSVTGSIDISLIIQNLKKLTDKDVTMKDGLEVVKDLANDIKEKVDEVNQTKKSK